MCIAEGGTYTFGSQLSAGFGNPWSSRAVSWGRGIWEMRRTSEAGTNINIVATPRWLGPRDQQGEGIFEQLTGREVMNGREIQFQLMKVDIAWTIEDAEEQPHWSVLGKWEQGRNSTAASEGVQWEECGSHLNRPTQLWLNWRQVRRSEDLRAHPLHTTIRRLIPGKDLSERRRVQPAAKSAGKHSLEAAEPTAKFVRRIQCWSPLLDFDGWWRAVVTNRTT